MENRLYNSNNRAVIDEGGNVKQVTNFYPFGGVFSTTAYSRGDDLQPYKYNGKELDRIHGLDWYDYGARNYDAIVPCFTSMDRFCEKYYHISPYAYCAGNPVNSIDLNGDSIWITYKGQDIRYENGKLYNKDGSSYTGKVGSFLNPNRSLEILPYIMFR